MVDSSAVRVAVVIPTYNEVDNIGPLCRALADLDAVSDIIVVDDASPDGTAAAVLREAEHDRSIHLISRAAKLGLGSAYAAGMKLALSRGARAVLTMDADFSHDPADVPRLAAGMGRFDVTVGSRYVRGGAIENWSLMRRLLSRTANGLTRILLHLPVRDCTAGFRCYSRHVLETIGPDSVRSHGYAYLEEMMLLVVRSGFTVGEVPIVFRDRRRGRSKISRMEIARGAWTLLRLFLRPPGR